jgi:hypothetical protein
MFAQAESLRLSLHALEEALKEYSPLMSRSAERAVGAVIKYGGVFAEVSPAIWKPSKTLTPFV